MRIDPNPIWYGHRHPLALMLAPLGWLYCGVARLRRWAYRAGWLASVPLPVPVVVIGNLSVGGTGKTPTVLALAELLRAHGHRPAILTRGYGARGETGPRRVPPDADPRRYGDEPVLLARRAHCPVVVGADRVAAGRLALERGDVDILLTDDGLQHYRLRRDLEIALVDGQRGLGNRRCLPAGPLREPPRRLATVDEVLIHGEPTGQGAWMRLVPGDAIRLDDPSQTRPLAAFAGRRVLAVAAIGHPERFFTMLQGLGILVEGRAYPDHHPFTAADVASWPSGPVLMTEKDAVKCAPFAGADHWLVPVEAVFDPAFVSRVLRRLETREIIRSEGA